MSRRLRIAWVAQEDSQLPPTSGAGSVSEVAWQLIQRLKEPCDTLVATRPHPELATQPLMLDGVEYVRADISRDLRRARWVHRLNQMQRALGLADVPYPGRRSYFQTYARQHAEAIAEWSPDVVHLENNSCWVPVFRRAMPGTAIVLHMHSEWLTDIPFQTGAARLREVDRVVAVSDHVADLIRERYPDVAERVAVVPNGVDLSRFLTRARAGTARRQGIERLKARLALGRGPVVLFVGRISAEKGLHHLLEALPAIERRVPGVRIILCGPPYALRSPLPTRQRRELEGHPAWRARYDDYLRRLAAPLGDGVVFAGNLTRHEVELAYGLADVYVQPSTMEASPLPVVEAMASGVPIVATTAGGIPGQVVDGETGLLVPPRDPTALANAISRVLLDSELSRRLVAAGLERARQGLTWEASADLLLEVYRSLADGLRQPDRSASAFNVSVSAPPKEFS